MNRYRIRISVDGKRKLYYELENSTSPEGRRVHLLGLRDLYDFCTEQWIEDIPAFPGMTIFKVTATALSIRKSCFPNMPKTIIFRIPNSMWMMVIQVQTSTVPAFWR